MNAYAPNSYNAETERFDCCEGRVCTCEPKSTPHFHRCYGCAEEIPSMSYSSCTDAKCGIDPAEYYAGRLCARHVGAREYNPKVKPYTCCEYRRWCVCGNKQAAVDR